VDVTATLALLERTRVALEGSDPVDVGPCRAAVDALPAVAESLPPEELAALREAIDAVEAAARVRMAHIDEQMRLLARQREGVRGYAHLRSHHKAQKLFKRA
jgi:hypothetical protein